MRYMESLNPEKILIRGRASHRSRLVLSAVLIGAILRGVRLAIDGHSGEGGLR